MIEDCAEFKKTRIFYNKTTKTMFLGHKFRLYDVDVKIYRNNLREKYD
jgi:hypothetical protein